MVKRAIPRKKMYTGLYDVVYAREETKPLVKAMLSASQHQNLCYGHEPVYWDLSNCHDCRFANPVAGTFKTHFW